MGALMDKGDGTFASYQGFGLRRCTFQRSRGWGSTGSVVELMADPGWKIEPPNLADLFRSVAAVAVAAQTPGSGVRRELPKKLDAAGYLRMKEVVRGEVWEHPPVLLYVVRAEEARRSDTSGAVRLRLSLEDVRFFWPRGLLDVWSFNRHRADGSVALDSVKPDGTRYSKAEVAQKCAARLPSTPTLSAYPRTSGAVGGIAGNWDQDLSPQEFPRFGSAVAALATFQRKSGLEDPCLRLDGTLALHAAGDGLVGYARDGKGPNTEAIPTRFMLDKNGAGKGRTLEPGYPEEFVVVVGGERVVTVAIDDWEPVLQFPGGQVRKLDEALVRTLTDGKFGIDWLARFVLRPSAYQSNPDLRADVAGLFADQAWQLYRMPGVEIETADAAPLTARSLVGGAEPAEAHGGAKSTGPGPNAHLLPILPRAETVNGRRQAATVEAYSFTTEHVKLRASPAAQALAAVQKEIAALRATAPALDAQKDFALLRSGGRGEGRSAQIQADDVFRGEELRLINRGVQISDIEAALTRVREIEQFRTADGLGPAFADQLLDLERKKLAAEEELGAEGGRSEIFDIALSIFQGEKQLKADLDTFTNPLKEANPNDQELEEALFRRESSRQAILGRIDPLLTKAESERKARADRLNTTGSPATSAGDAFGLVVLSNRPVDVLAAGTISRDANGLLSFAKGSVTPAPRAVDTGARVVDAEAGLVKLSSLGGHVFPNGAADASSAVFVPRAVRVTFGVVLRPRIDVPPDAVPAPPTQTSAPQREVVAEEGDSLHAALDRLHRENERVGDTLRQALERYRASVVDVQPGGGQNVISDVLSDQESYYSAAFRRTARGQVEPVPIDVVAWDRAARIDQPDMVELVHLDGATNRGVLDDQARQLAAERSNQPDVLDSQRYLLARPWPVQCDGVVSSVTITMREKNGTPCGFETLVTTGSSAAPPVGPARTAVRPSAQNGGHGARREGLS